MKKYQIIYADPAWVYKDKLKFHGGGAASHYKCTPTEEMGKLQIPSEKDSELIMWCTYPMIEEGSKLMKMWGFKYKSVFFTWVKLNKDGSFYMGMGRRTRGNAEIALVGTKGKGVKRIDASIKNTQAHPRTKHSEKPNAFRLDIEKHYGNVSKLELFARKKSPGWDIWGNEVESSIDLTGEAKNTVL